MSRSAPLDVPLERILTHSRAKTFRACPRKHALAYTLGYRARGTSNALAFGNAVHKALEFYWLGRMSEQLGGASVTNDDVLAALDTLHDPFVRAKARVLVAAYCALWDVEAVTVLAVEAPFAFPLVNERGRASNYWFLGGKIDLLVQLADGRIAIVEHKCIAGSARIFDHSTGTYERADDLFCRGTAPVVTALDASGRLVAVQALPLRAASVRSIYSIATLGGRTLRVSGNHPVLTPNGWVAAEALELGDWVATPRQLACARPDAPLSDEAIRLLGYMIGDGALSRMSFTKNDPVVLADVVRCAAHEGEQVKLRHPDKRATYILFSRVGAVARLMSAAGFTAKTLSADKRIPFQLALSDRQIGQLLGALWSTDGCIDAFHGKKLRIIYTSRSRGLCEDIQHALQRLGIVANVRTTSVKYRGERRSVSTVNVVTRDGKRRFLALALEGIIPVLRSRVAIGDAFAFIPESHQGDDNRSQPRIDPSIWWDRIESIERQQEEQTYDVEVPGAHTFVVDGVITHNTSSEDTSAGGAYRDRLAMDSQVSIYFEGAKSLGYEADVCIYDVLLKPTQSPLEATPIEQRKYTKATKTKPSTLYANQREHSETPDEYEARIAAVVQSDVTRFLPRWEVPRLEFERTDAIRDLWATGQEILALENAVHPWPRRNPDACHAHGACEFLPVCRREASLEDRSIYVRIGPHPELQSEAEPPSPQESEA